MYTPEPINGFFFVMSNQSTALLQTVVDVLGSRSLAAIVAANVSGVLILYSCMSSHI